MRIVWGALIGIVGIAVSGCSPRGEQVMIQNARGIDYSQGYGDGCATARAQLGIPGAVARKDVKRFVIRLPYKNGWEAGYDECKFREKRVAQLSLEDEAEKVKIGGK